MAQLDAHPTGDQDVEGWTPLFRQRSFLEIDHEIFSTVILYLLLIQEGQLSVSGERICTSTGKLLRGLSLPRKRVRLIDCARHDPNGLTGP